MSVEFETSKRIQKYLIEIIKRHKCAMKQIK